MMWLERAVNGRTPYVVCLVLSLALYANTFKNQYALDDAIVISTNEYVLQGVRGLPGIFGNDLLASYTRQMNAPAQLTGGRYRPLSVATFAIEQELIGTRRGADYGPTCWDVDADGRQDTGEDVNGDGLYNDEDCRARGFGLRHVDNALLYGLAVCALYHFLSSVAFAGSKRLALIVSLLFLAHPVHVEAVANVKSRDEILSFLFVVLTLSFAHRCGLNGGARQVALACLAFLCALLSKENGFTLLVLVPLSLHLFGAKGLRPARHAALLGGMALSFVAYWGVRSRIIIWHASLQDAEIMNNPYLLATPVQQWATKLLVFLKYGALLVFPHPLSSDYGYRAVPYADFLSVGPWLGMLAGAGLLAAGALALLARHWLAFAVAVYLLPLLLVSNVFFNVGAVMGERFLFQPSLGYCMALGFLLLRLGESRACKPCAAAIVLTVLTLYSVKTLSRNRAWQSDATLALTDVETMPDSVLLNGNAAARTLDMSEWPVNAPRKALMLQQAVSYGEKAIRLHPRNVNAHLTVGLAHARMGRYDDARRSWDIAFKLYPDHPLLARYLKNLAAAYHQQGIELGRRGRWRECRETTRKAVSLAPGNARYWRGLGTCAYNDHDPEAAKAAWEQARQLDAGDDAHGNEPGPFKAPRGVSPAPHPGVP